MVPTDPDQRHNGLSHRASLSLGMTPASGHRDTDRLDESIDGVFAPGLPRRQKVVLVMDLVESVRLMAANEAAVVQRWHGFVQHARAHVLPRHHGRHVKSLGDGLLAEFDSAPEAVTAAHELHHFFDDTNAALPPDQRFHLRAGLNAAQIYIDSVDVYGAGVNLAARAQGAATGYDNAAWQSAYLVMAASMVIGVLTVLLSPEPAPLPLAPARNAREWLRTALIEPFADFFRRYKWQAALILALIAVYRISDVVMGIMANPFYVDMGYTKDEVAAVTKVYGVIMTLSLIHI